MKSNKPLRVLHLLNTNKFSGAENVVCHIISLFDKSDNIEMIYCSPDGPINKALKERNISFYPLKELNKHEVKRAIKDYKPNIIHAHDMKASYVASLACKGIPIVSHIHNGAFDSRKLSVKSIAYFWATRKISHIIWVSKGSFESYYFKKYLFKKSSILYNVISKEKLIDKVNEDNNVYDYDVVYLGRLTYQKHPERLIEVCKKIVQQKDDTKIAIVGSGDLFEETKQLSDSLGLSNNIFFLGFLSNPYKILQDCKVMLMTSRWEGIPMAVLEAQMLGVPIVSTPVEGVVDIITNDKNGFISDDNEILASFVVSIVSNEEKHRTLSQNSTIFMERFCDLTKYKEHLLSVYHSIEESK